MNNINGIGSTESLQNHFLIAMPALQGGLFERSVVYVCQHNSDGAMGLIINRPLDISVDELLQQMKLTQDSAWKNQNSAAKVLMGGPISPERGFVLHTPQKNWSHSITLNKELMLTTSKDILSSIGTEQAPEDYIVVLGYSGWDLKQLEQEISHNSWLTLPATPRLLFDVECDQRWQQASRSLGFDAWQMPDQIGHA